jgi:hypothetical protein
MLRLADYCETPEQLMALAATSMKTLLRQLDGNFGCIPKSGAAESVSTHIHMAHAALGKLVDIIGGGARQRTS